MNERIRQTRDAKHRLSDEICREWKERAWTNKKIEINGMPLCVAEKREYTPLTFSYVEKCLGEIMPNKDQVEHVMLYLKQQREVTLSPELRVAGNSARAKTPSKRRVETDGVA